MKETTETPTETETLKERERIKELIIRKINARVEWRKKHIKKTGVTPIFAKLKDDLLFLIDNPDYKPKGYSPKKKPKSES